MTPERYRQIGELYHAALEREAGERASFLEKACAGDPELRREVESLIASHEQRADFMAASALTVAAGMLAESEAGGLTGQTIGRYCVQSLLGAGGMGRVFLAEDAGLGRRVALKLLREYFTHDESHVHRFRREARAASALNHPNIVTIHEIGQSGPVHFIATEFIDGETLRRAMARTPMPVHEVLDVAVQVASALQAAHEAGIVHRDIKPENIMLRRDGIAKVLDFGVAKLGVVAAVPAAHSLDRTTPGTVIGTAAYMAPEQARGQDVDARADLWSLGVVLYEMLTGRLPFAGESASDVVAAILTTQPSPLARHAPEAPDELQRIVHKCLEKNPEERYQSANDLLVDLRQLKKGLEAGEPVAGIRSRVVAPFEWSATARLRWILPALAAAMVLIAIGIWMVTRERTPTRPAIRSVAVLPFVNLSGNPEDDYLSAAMSEEIINALAALPSLKVVARSSSSAFQGQPGDVREAGRKLAVAAVVQGSVQRSGERIRVHAQLVDVADGVTLWSDRFDRRLTDVFAIQDEIARAIASAMRARIAGGSKMVRPPTADMEAYALYIKGRESASVWTPQRFEQAIAYYRAALDRDPQFAEAWAGLADLYSVMDHRPGLTSLKPSESYRLAMEGARKALELDPNLAEAHAAMGHIQTHLGEFALAKPHLQRAVALNPNSAMAHIWSANVLCVEHRVREAKEHIARAREIDPLSALVSRVAAINLWMMGEFEAGADTALGGLAVQPEASELHLYAARNLASMGRHRDAAAEIDRAIAAGEKPAFAEEERALVFALAGRRKEATALLDRFERQTPPPTALAMMRAYAALGDVDAAARWLDRLVAGNPEYARLSSQLPPHPAFARFRADPRFISAQKRLGMPL